jgi:hypothetical protein
MMTNFRFNTPVDFFEKADAPAGQRRRIGGVISTENRDQEGEVILQRGLDLQPFLTKGWLNDNHSKATADGVLGYPQSVKQFQKGERLPNGKIAKAACTWFEGYLLEGWPPADKVWNLGKALKGTGRQLGYSVEGSIVKRVGAKTVFKKSRDGDGGQWVGDTVAKAVVRNVAITNCPINADTSMEVLAKAFADADVEVGSSVELTLTKALTMGTPTPGVSVATAGPMTGEGAGRVAARQDLEWDGDGRGAARKKARRKGLKSDTIAEKSLTSAEAAAWVRERMPGLPDAQVQQFITTVRRWKASGALEE